MSKDSRIKEKIQLYLEKKGLTEYEFYKNSGVSRGVLKHPSGISEENIAKFLAYDQQIGLGKRINLDWLFRDEGAMFETFDPEKNLALEPHDGYGEEEPSLEEVLQHLSNMTESYSINLKEVVKAVNKAKK